MLDAYIIDRIRREQEQARSQEKRQPLEIEAPRPMPRVPSQPPGASERGEKEEGERGSTVIDFRV